LKITFAVKSSAELLYRLRRAARIFPRSIANLERDTNECGSGKTLHIPAPHAIFSPLMGRMPSIKTGFTTSLCRYLSPVAVSLLPPQLGDCVRARLVVDYASRAELEKQNHNRSKSLNADKSERIFSDASRSAVVEVNDCM
jgi:hypothetical protein